MYIGDIMSKSNIMISIDSELIQKSKERLKGNVSKICEGAIRKELGIIENAPDEMKQLEQLLEIKQNVQRLATQDGGNFVVRMVAADLKKKNGEPKTFKEKLSFWETIYKEAKLKLIRARTEDKVSPAPLPKKVQPNIFNDEVKK